MKTIKLGNITEIRTGKLDANAATKEGKYPFFTCAIEPSRIDTYSFEGENILVAGNGDLNVKYYEGKCNAYQRTYVIQVKEKTEFNTKYLYYLLQSKLKKLREESLGGVIKYIKLENLTQIEVKLLPKQEQDKIVEKLDKLQEIIQIRKEQLQFWKKYQEIKLYNLIGTVQKNPKHLPEKTIGEVAKVQGGYAFKSKDYVENSNLALLQISNVYEKTVNWKGKIYLPEAYQKTYSEYVLQEGDIVLAMTRPVIKSLETVKIVVIQQQDLPCLLNQRVGRFQVNTNLVEPLFLYYYCKSSFFTKEVERLSGNSLQPNISAKQIEGIKLLLPTKQQQQEFLVYMKQAEEQIEPYKQSLQELEELMEIYTYQYFS